MLALAPGKGLLEIPPGGADAQAPFSLFVGFKWGPTFSLCSSTKPILRQLEDLGRSLKSEVYFCSTIVHLLFRLWGDDSKLMVRRIRFNVTQPRMFVFVRAVAPYTVEVCVSTSAQLQEEAGMQLQRITFTNRFDQKR